MSHFLNRQRRPYDWSWLSNHTSRSIIFCYFISISFHTFVFYVRCCQNYAFFLNPPRKSEEIYKFSEKKQYTDVSTISKTRLWIQYNTITICAYVLLLLLNTFSKTSCEISFWHLIISCWISSACCKSPIFTQYWRSLWRVSIASKLFPQIAKAAKSFCCSLLAATLSTLNILFKNVYIIAQLYWLINLLTQSFYPHAVPARIIWRRALMPRQPYSIAVPSTGGRLHPSLFEKGFCPLWGEPKGS